MKLLFTFEKGEPVRWLGHLDVMRAFERAIRRSGLPVAFSTGFNPRERLSFASALGVGVTGGAERGVLELTDDVPVDRFTDALNAVLPPGLRITGAEPIPDAGSRDRLNAYGLCELRLQCTTSETPDEASVTRAVDEALSLPHWWVERVSDKATRRIDIRPFVRQVATERCEQGGLTLLVTVEVGQYGTARPAEIVAVLANAAAGLALRRAHRVRLLENTGIA